MALNDPPLVSVGIRTRNRAHYLREAVESVLAQTFRDWELLLSDDASSDETPDLCAAYARQDPRIHIFRHEPPLGMVNNGRFLIDRSRGKYFATLDDDNRYLPTFLEKAVAALTSAPQAGFAFADEWRIDDLGERQVNQTEAVSNKYRRTRLAYGLCWNTLMAALHQSPGINSTVFARDLLTATGGFREMAGAAYDFDCFVNLAQRGCPGFYLGERLVEYRNHDAQDSVELVRSEEKAETSVAILETYRFTGEAERLRRRKLAIAYSALGRTRLLNGNVRGARSALTRAWWLLPRRLKSNLALLALCLPPPLLRPLLAARYDNRTAPRKS